MPVEECAGRKFLKKHGRSCLHGLPERVLGRKLLDMGSIVFAFIDSIYAHKLESCRHPAVFDKQALGILDSLYHFKRINRGPEIHRCDTSEHYFHCLTDVLRNAEEILYSEHLDMFFCEPPPEFTREGIDFPGIFVPPEERALTRGGNIARQLHIKPLADEVEPHGQREPCVLTPHGAEIANAIKPTLRVVDDLFVYHNAGIYLVPGDRVDYGIKGHFHELDTRTIHQCKHAASGRMAPCRDPLSAEIPGRLVTF